MTKLRNPILITLFAGLLLVSTTSSAVEFGKIDFWQVHGLLFLFFIAAFPRLTLLFSSVATGGLFWWLGWLFAPRLLVAILATIAYWNTNEILVIFSWLIALGGESSEKVVVHRKTRSKFPGKTIDVEYKEIN